MASLLNAGPGGLENLEIPGNRIGDAGAVALAKGLAGSGSSGGRKRRPQSRQEESDVKQGHPECGIRRLDLAGNGIGCVGACALAKALKESRGKVVLEELELAGNAVSSRRS